MKDNVENKFFTHKDNCSLMEEIWRDVFKISDEENYLIKITDYINCYINANINKIKAFPTVNLSRIKTENYNTREVTLDEIKGLIRKNEKEHCWVH